MRSQCILVVVLAACSGCVTAPLERYTLNQSLSVSEMRYQEVMNALAMVAHNQGNLPSYDVNAGGVANVSATVTTEETTTWNRSINGFAQQILNFSGKHSPELQWQLNPVAEQPLLEGAWYACRWALYGQPSDPAELQKEYDLLRAPTLRDIVGCKESPTRTYHLSVLDENGQIPCGWLGVGEHCAPHGVCYQAHCGETFVWVMPENLPALSEFTLVLADIATIDPAWLALQKLQATASVDLSLPGAADPTKSTITETWMACQEAEPDGSIRIVVAPFAEPPGSQVVEKSTLRLYSYEVPTTPTTAAPSGHLSVRIQAPKTHLAPQPTAQPARQPAPAPASVHVYRQ
jgi:hypothetical protein